MPVRVTAISSRPPSLITTASRSTPRAPDFSAVGVSFTELGNALLRERARRDETILAKEIGNFRIERAKSFRDAADAYDGSTDGFADGQLKAFDAAVDERAGMLANKRLQKAFRERIINERDNAFVSAQEYERRQTGLHALGNFREAAGILRNGVLLDPSSEAAARADMGRLAEQLPPALRDQALREENEALTQSFIDGRLSNDPFGLEKEIHAGKLNDRATSKQLKQAIDEIVVERRRRTADAERKAALERAVRSVQLRGLIDDDLASMEATGEGVEGVDPLEVARVLGPDDLERYLKKRETAKKAFASTEGFADNSIEGIEDRLLQLAPQPGQADFAAQQEIFERAAAVAQRDVAARLKDPAAYYRAADTAAQTALDAYQEARQSPEPEKRALAGKIFDAYASRIEARQNAGGIPASLRRLLPENEAKAIVAGVVGAPPEERAKQMRDLAASLDQNFGRNADRVLGELVDAGLPREVQVLRAVADDPAASTRIAQAIDQRDAVKDLVSTADTRKTGDALRGELGPLFDTFAQSPDGAALAASFQDTLQATAEYMIVREGMKPAEAAKAAAKMVAGGYTIVGTWRAPKGVDAKAVERSANRVVDGLLANDGAVLAPNAGSAGLSEAQRKILYSDVVRQNSSWITNESEDGLVLVDSFGRPVIDANGEAVEASFTELEMMEQQRRRQ